MVWCVIASVLLLGLVGQTYALSCYVCASSVQGHDKCGEEMFVPTTATVLHNCSACQTSVHAINTVSVVQRQCVKNCVPQSADEEQQAVAARLTVECCTSDLCNSAPRMTTGIAAGICVVMVILRALRII